MFGRKHFYLMYSPLMMRNDMFDSFRTRAAIQGIRPIDRKLDTMEDLITGMAVTGCCLIECREMWKGALKSWLKYYGKKDTGYEVDGLKVYS